MPPAIALAEPGESFAVIKPLQVFVNVEPCVIRVGEDVPYLTVVGICKQDTIPILQPIDVLDDEF